MASLEEVPPKLVSRTALEELKEKRKLPPKPGDSVSFKELTTWLNELTPEMTDGNRVNIYVYRLEPVIIRQLTNPEYNNNIDVISDGFDGLTEDYIVKTHGGGRYKLLVKDLDKPKEQKGGYFEAKLYIPMITAPPILNLKEVDWEHRNNKGYRMWAKSQGLIDDKGMPTIEKKTEGNGGNDNNSMVQAMKLAMDFVTKMGEKDQADLKRKLAGEDGLGKSIGDILLEKMKQEDPNKQLATVTTLISAMKGMQPEVKPDNTLAVIMPVFMQMMQQASEASNKQFMMMMELMKSKNEGGGEGKGAISEVKEMFGLFQEMNGNSGKKSTVEVIANVISDNLAPVLGVIANVVALKTQASGVKPIEVPNNQTANTVVPTNGQPMNNTPQLSQNQLTQALAQFAPLIGKGLGKEGWEFACELRDMINMYPGSDGNATVASITKEGEDKLFDAMMQVPALQETITKTYGIPHVKNWLVSFCNWIEEERKDLEAEIGEGTVN